MKITEALRVRRTYYAINRELPVSIGRVIDMTKELTELVPDAYNMKSSRVVVVYGESRISSGTGYMMFLKVKLPVIKSTVFVRAAVQSSTSMTERSWRPSRNSFRAMQTISRYGHLNPAVCCSFPSGAVLGN